MDGYSRMCSSNFEVASLVADQGLTAATLANLGPAANASAVDLRNTMYAFLLCGVHRQKGEGAKATDHLTHECVPCLHTTPSLNRPFLPDDPMFVLTRPRIAVVLAVCDLLALAVLWCAFGLLSAGSDLSMQRAAEYRSIDHYSVLRDPSSPPHPHTNTRTLGPCSHTFTPPIL